MHVGVDLSKLRDEDYIIIVQVIISLALIRGM